MLSRKCSQGILALMQLCRYRESEPDVFIKAGPLSKKLGIPTPILGKVLHQLASNGLIESLKGPSGGVRLTREPAEIGMLEIIHVLEGPHAFQKCIMGFEQCGGGNPCPLHEQWGGARKSPPHLGNRLDKLGEALPWRFRYYGLGRRAVCLTAHRNCHASTRPGSGLPVA